MIEIFGSTNGFGPKATKYSTFSDVRIHIFGLLRDVVHAWRGDSIDDCVYQMNLSNWI